MRALRRARYHANREKYLEQNRGNYERHREKRLAYQATYQAKHREEHAARHKQWAAQNREHLRQYHKEYRNSDAPGAVNVRERQSAYSRKYRESSTVYQEAHRAKQAVRRARGAQTALITISQALFDADDLCHLCGGPISSAAEADLDHILPLAQGGKHTRDNLAPAHRRCNRIKRGLHPENIPPHIVRKFGVELNKRCPPPNWPID